ncbi:MAG: bifunctional proline dehydrogenase/L-glutamate gamma-semialdehyde dehydrogenase PutA [Gammaproteobacteria bacterium]
MHPIPRTGLSNRLWLAPEAELLGTLLPLATLPAGERAQVQVAAVELIEAVRHGEGRRSGMDRFLREFDLSSREGVILMCLAEALLRIPDAATADRLIADKLSIGDWAGHLGRTDSLFVNAGTWGLMLTGRWMAGAAPESGDFSGALGRLVTRVGEPVVRAALRQGMRILGHQFVMGRTIEEALARAGEPDGLPWRYSFDMLGEAALTTRDAERYLQAYQRAIAAVAGVVPRFAISEDAPSISVKLSALHPRYEPTQRARVLDELLPRLQLLAAQAADAGVSLTLDAEESERLELSLELLECLLRDPNLEGWTGLGLAVQAYQRRALEVVDHVIALAGDTGRRLNVRLVKGAYWDSEIKRAQEQGLSGYPVFTRKTSTDVSYLACARRLLLTPAPVYPQFATHNAHTVAWIRQVARQAGRAFEFQRLHGMGEELHGVASRPDAAGQRVPCRVYAPVGSHEDLLPYLVRRLLENGANTSFVNRIVDERLPAAEVAADPVAATEAVQAAGVPAHPAIPLPTAIFPDGRRNSRGYLLADSSTRNALSAALGTGQAALRRPVPDATDGAVAAAVTTAVAAQRAWNRRGGPARALVLEKAAELLEDATPELLALCVHEAGKTLPDAVGEVREAVDFLRYYAQEARLRCGEPLSLPGPTGERNTLSLEGRGVFACISPWNFPLAIFIGQVSAALAAGNAVLAKPAEQTPRIAGRAVELLHAAGVPREVLHFLPGPGESVGTALVDHPAVAGVAFTGSTEVAKLIQRRLAAREGAVPVLVAETGGQNLMVVDSSALPEQVVRDVMASAFNSAGQRCSALRVLCLQEEIADRVLALLAGAMDELRIGPPGDWGTDVGPVIDAAARRAIEEHIERVVPGNRWWHRCRMPPGLDDAGHFVAPVAVEIPTLSVLRREVFGPVLHVLRWRAGGLGELLGAAAATGYALTFGLQTRLDSTIAAVCAEAPAGNVYVNRNMIGAVVGVQPFGGHGLSGTGPKAGGPNYLPRFAIERTITVNTTAVGGNASLLGMG